MKKTTLGLARALALCLSWPLLTPACGGAVAGGGAERRQPPGPSAARAGARPDALPERDARVAGERFTYAIRVRPLANLVYQLDCLARVADACSADARAAYRELWSGLGFGPDDEAALASWRTLRSRYGGEITRNDEPAPAWPLLAPSRAYDVAKRQRIAALTSPSPAAYEAALALLSTEPEARQLGALLARFGPRFGRWWSAVGCPASRGPFEGLARLLRDPALTALIARASRFYEIDGAAGEAVELHLMVRPASARRGTRATPLEGHAVLETVAGERAESSIDVAAHELFHVFYRRVAPERRAAMLARVCSSDDPAAAASFGLLDEAVATALGNGLVGQLFAPPGDFSRRLARDDGLYRDRAVNAAARALLPSIGGLLERGSTISSDEFLRAYYDAARAAYPGGRPRPLDHLRSHVLVSDPPFADAAGRLQGATRANYSETYDAFDARATTFVAEHPCLSAALLVPKRDAARRLGALAPREHAGALTELARRGRGFVYALPRTPGSYAFVFAADDAATMNELVGRFAALDAARAGALVELPQ